MSSSVINPVPMGGFVFNGKSYKTEGAMKTAMTKAAKKKK
jgi:hypothetical protein